MPTAEERTAAKLAKLRAEATELKVEFNDETTAEELADKVKEAKAAAKQAAKASKTSFTVYKNGYPVRTYSVEQHGENAEDLANEFCAHSGDEVK